MESEISENAINLLQKLYIWVCKQNLNIVI